MRLCHLSVASVVVLSMALCFGAQAEDAKSKAKVPHYLQEISVTVRTERGSGSGTIVKTKDDTVWVWTAGHVVEALRRVEQADGKTKIYFSDAKIIQFRNDKTDGRIVSSFSFDAEVIRYSGIENGHDLALLRIRDKEFKPKDSAKFYLDKELPELGEELYHCGSLLGPFGSNSLMAGIISQHGRVIDGKVYSQCQVGAFPGSSGGVVCLRSDGRYIGMLVRGAGEGFNLIVPISRMREWAKKVGVEFTIDPSLPVPDNDKLMSVPVDDSVEAKSPPK